MAVIDQKEKSILNKNMFKRCRFLLPDLTVSPSFFFYLSGNKGDFRQLSDVFDQTDTVYIDWSLTQKEIINNTVKCGNKSPEKKRSYL